MGEYSTAAGEGSGQDPFLNADTLEKLRNGTDMMQVAAAWLAAFAKQTSGIQQGLVVMAGTGKAKFEPVAMWPDGASPAPELMRAVDGCLKGKRMLVETGSQENAAIAVPMLIGGQLRGALAVLADNSADTDLRRVVDQLQWASGWIEAVVRRQPALHPFFGSGHGSGDRTCRCFGMRIGRDWHDARQARAAAGPVEFGDLWQTRYIGAVDRSGDGRSRRSAGRHFPSAA